MAKFFTERPIVAMVISIMIFIFGLISIPELPIDQFPQIVPPEILVNTTYTGADALTIEQSVATPLEQKINGVEKMLYMKSVNANDGTMSLRVTFDVESDGDMNNVLVQNRVNQASPSLPQEVSSFGVTVEKSTTMPLLLFSLFSPDERYDANFLGNYGVININDELLRIPGITQITNFGSAEYAMRVWIKPDKIASMGLTVSDIVNAVQTQNIQNPAGQIGAEPAPAGQEFTFTVRAQGRLETAKEFNQIVVRTNPDGSQLRLKDVARVELGAQNYFQKGGLNGKTSAIIAIYKTAEANALEVAKMARAKMIELEKNFPSGLEYEVSLDTTLPISEGVKEMIVTFIEAFILVVLVVFVFLQSWRATLIPLLTIPVAIVGSFSVFSSLGFSINTVSLFGLILAIGTVVDDAIVVVEAVQKGIDEGLTPKEATVKAMEMVSGPVVATTLILLAVFVPVGFMGGIKGRLFQQFAITISVSVVISSINALTLSPALCSVLLKPTAKAPGILGRFFDGFNRGFEKATSGYLKISKVFVRRTTLSLMCLALFFVLTGVFGKLMPTGFVPEEDQGYLFVNVQLPDAASLQRTEQASKKVEKVLDQFEEISNFNTIVGYSMLSQSSASYMSFFFIELKPWAERQKKEQQAEALVRRLNRAFSKIPEAIVFAFPPPAIPGLGTGGGFSLMVQDQTGSDVNFLDKNVERFIEEAEKRPEIARMNTTFRAGVPQYFAKVDKDKILKQGINIQDVYSALQTFLGGIYVNDFNNFGRQWKVFLQAEPEYRLDPNDIDQFYVKNRQGVMVPLSTLVSTEKVYGPESTTRFNLFRSAEITGGPAAGFSSGQAMNALEEVAATTLPEGVSYAWNALSYQEKSSEGGAFMTFFLSILFVFLLLAALYESWSLPFGVLLGTPIAIFGAFFGLWLRGMEQNVYAQIGIIMLIGLAAKNSILIVEFAKAEVERGQDALTAAMEAGKQRLRPIMMTAFTFILGCMPLWFANGAGAMARKLTGTAVIMGMTTATLLGIFLTPALFVFINNLVSKKKKELSNEQVNG